MDPNPFSSPTGGGWWNTVWGTSDCDPYAPPCDLSYYAYGWGSNNTPVATVDSGGYGQGISPGTAGISGFLMVPSYYFKCPLREAPVGTSGTVISLSQSPPALNMSSGDTGKYISVSISPSGAIVNLVFGTGLNANQNSSSQATFGVAGNSSASGTANYAINVSGSNSPSGIFSAVATASGASGGGTVVTIPPQVLVQVLYGEAHGQAVSGDLVSQPAIGSAIKNRFGRSEFPGGVSGTYQAVIISSQFAGISTSITTGVLPELDTAVALFNGSQSDTVAGSPCFFSPTAAGWAAIQAALNSGTTVVPNVSFDPDCYGGNRQLVYKSTIGNHIDGRGAPAFIFEREKSSPSAPAVVQIP